MLAFQKSECSLISRTAASDFSDDPALVMQNLRKLLRFSTPWSGSCFIVGHGLARFHRWVMDRWRPQGPDPIMVAASDIVAISVCWAGGRDISTQRGHNGCRLIIRREWRYGRTDLV